jgi:hypothetical protein
MKFACDGCRTPTEYLHRDRIVPGFKGGTFRGANVQRLCVDCHANKTKQEMREYWALPRSLNVSAKEFWPVWVEVMATTTSEDAQIAKLTAWASEHQRRVRGTRLEQPAVPFLRQLLADGPVSLDELRRLSLEADLSWRQMERAKSRLAVVSVKSGFPAIVVGWALPRCTEEEKQALRASVRASIS